MKKIFKLMPVDLLSLSATLLVAYLSLSSRPLGETDLMFFPGADKVFHFVMYFGVTCAYIIDYAKCISPHHTKVNLEFMFTCCAMLLGLLMEIGQLVVSNGRSYDSFDIVANCAGALTAFAWLHYRGLKRFRRFYIGSRHRHRH